MFKNKKINFKVVFFGCLVVCGVTLLLAGCLAKAGEESLSNAGSYYYDSAVNLEPTEAYSKGFAAVSTDDFVSESLYEYNDFESSSKGGSEVSNVSTGRKLITTYDITVETEEFDSFHRWILKAVKDSGGYISNSDLSNDRSRVLEMTLRIPSNSAKDFVEQIGVNSNVLRNSESTEDVTLQYTDVETKKKSLEIEMGTLLELLEKAENLSDILEIQDRIATVRYMLESQESQLRLYDNLIDYSTITLMAKEVKQYTPPEPLTFMERIRTGFAENLEDVGETVEDITVFVLTHIPAFIALIVFCILLAFVFKFVVYILSKVKHLRVKKFKVEDVPSDSEKPV